MEKDYYLRVEAVNLANFVYDTQSLSTIRGGGLLLLDSIGKIKEKADAEGLDFKVIVAASSYGLFSYRAAGKSAAQEVCQKIIAFINEDKELKHATFVVDYVVKTGKDQLDFQHLEAKVHWQQLQAPTLRYPRESSEKVCVIDQINPAPEKNPGPEEGKKKGDVSKSVAMRYHYGRDRRKGGLYETITGQKILSGFSDNFNLLAKDESKGQLDGKMAVIYIDGNRFGTIKKDVCSDEESTTKFSEHIKETQKKIVKKLLEKIQQDKEWLYDENNFEAGYRLETLLWGGDELIWVVPAWKGWEALSCFYEAVKDNTYKDKPLTYAAALIFCNHKAPIHRITKLADELVTVIKEKNSTDPYKNRFAYLTLESFDFVGRDLEDFLPERWGGDLSPYFLDGKKMKEINDNFNILKDESFSTTRLHRIAAGLSSKEPAEKDKAIRLIKKTEEEHKTLLAKLQPDGIKGDARWMHWCDLWKYIPEEKKGA